MLREDCMEASESSCKLIVPCNPSSTVTDVGTLTVIVTLQLFLLNNNNSKKMSSSPTFIINPTSGVEEEEMLAIGQDRSHTSPPRSRPNSRLEILIMDLIRSQREWSNRMGRLSSLEVSRHGTPSTSPNPGRRGSPSSAETMHVSVPSTNGDFVPLSQAEVRSERLLLKPRPDYRLLNRSAIRPDKSITAIEEDAEGDDLIPIWRGTTLNPIAGEMTFRRGPGDITSREIIREGQDIVIESRIVR